MFLPQTVEMLAPPDNRRVTIEGFMQNERDHSRVVYHSKVIRKSAILRNRVVVDYYKSIFEKCDVNKDGCINISELREFISTNEEVEIPEEVIETLHAYFDKDKDNQLDFHEFLDLINNPTFGQTFKRVQSRYLKFVGVSSVRKKSLTLRRTVTNTGLYEEEIVFRKHTVGMLILSAIQVACFYIDKMLPEKKIEEALQFDPSRKCEIWRYFTCVFVHANTVHLYGNVLIQILIGVPLEMVHSWRVLVIYIAGGFGGSLAYSVLDNDGPLVGGSGGVYAFYTAHIATVIMNWREMSHPIVHLLIFGFIAVFDVVYNNYINIHKINVSNVSYIAHLGGAVVGLLLGVNVLRNLRETKTEKIMWYISVIILSTLLVIFIGLDIAYDDGLKHFWN